jgi:hypothetical protein
MDSITFVLGGLLAGTLLLLTVVFRTGHLTVVLGTRRQTPKAMPTLAMRKPRSPSSVRRRRRNSPEPQRGRNRVGFAKTSKRARTKTRQISEPSQTEIIPTATVMSFDTCPSCGLQAPESLLAEHFLGSPSHMNGPPKIAKADIAQDEAVEEAGEDDSKQSVRNLLQMLVPPRAFGRRHAHRSISPISSIIKDLGPPHRRYP